MFRGKSLSRQIIKILSYLLNPSTAVFDFISVCFKSNLTFECTFATTMNQTNIKTRDNDAHETTQAAKRARTAEEQDNIQPHSSTMDIIHTSHNPLSDITNVRAINAAVASENHL